MTADDEEIELTSRSAFASAMAGLLDLGRVPGGVGTVINLAFAALGVWIYLAMDGVGAFGGVVLAILSVLAIVRWVFQL